MLAFWTNYWEDTKAVDQLTPQDSMLSPCCLSMSLHWPQPKDVPSQMKSQLAVGFAEQQHHHRLSLNSPLQLGCFQLSLSVYHVTILILYHTYLSSNSPEFSSLSSDIPLHWDPCLFGFWLLCRGLVKWELYALGDIPTFLHGWSPSPQDTLDLSSIDLIWQLVTYYHKDWHLCQDSGFSCSWLEIRKFRLQPPFIEKTDCLVFTSESYIAALGFPFIPLQFAACEMWLSLTEALWNPQRTPPSNGPR